jgi:putative molybdopterin biosynthesis protein
MTEQPGEALFLHDVPLSDAWARFRGALQAVGLWGPLAAESIPLDRARGRVTAEAIWAKSSSPHFHSAAMDGYAVRSADTHAATERSPVSLRLGDQAAYVDTGDALPDWADAVVPIEIVEAVDPDARGRATTAIRLRAPLAPWSHFRPIGEDIVVTELALPAGRLLRPVELGILAASGYASVSVWRQPRVAVLPTGSELVPPGTIPAPGQIIEFNSLVLAAQVEEWGGIARRLPIVPDQLEHLTRAVREASLDSDLVLVNAGSSAGSEDFTARVVSSLGQVLIHGVAVRPGHPVILGMLRVERPAGDTRPGAVPVIGVPGFPVSAALTGEIFVEPLLARWTGRPPANPATVRATLTRKVHSTPGDDEYLRVTLGRVGERLVAAPLPRGAGVLTSLARADGLVLIPAGEQGAEAGSQVEVRLYRSPQEIERTIVITGSHDLTIDLLAQSLAQSGIHVSAANVGSVGGLVALGRGEAHLAGSHLLDPESGEYNLPAIRKYLSGQEVVAVGFVERQQGLMLPAGNPKEIRGVEDLARPDVRFVNRQRGAGTRLLLDHLLSTRKIDPGLIHGYLREEYTHLAVAAAVQSGRADCAIGIRGAAEALGLAFLPLAEERYDLVLLESTFVSGVVAPLLALLEDQSFRAAIDAVPGYQTRPMGRILFRGTA